ncbi:MAG TPA: bifunctional riboflavin kinase/FAD synthetase [Flavobacterium sp.]|nr:bifunctional riboflavin kinase/FAD synthetase [Flavobacterium sp.]
MKKYLSINQFHGNKENVVTLGMFDGVHRGHQSILNRLKEAALDNNLESLVLTFFPHPRMVLTPNNAPKLLNTIEEKSFLLKKTGINHLVIHPFSMDFSQMEAEDFVKHILVDKLKTKKIIIGYDHRFGKNRSADFHDLVRFGEKYGFDVEKISAQTVDEISVSSTKIRTALEKGDIHIAKEYLGYDYFFSGTVVHGKKIGRTIGFPTANFEIDETYKLIPANGIYVVYSYIDNQKVWGMMSIGTNPTLGDNPQTIEVNYLDFNKDLYGQNLTIYMAEKIRDEATFISLDELKNALHQDLLYTQNYIKHVE